MAAEPQPERLPFEPSKKRQKPPKDSPTLPKTAKKPKELPKTVKKSEKASETADKVEPPRHYTKEEVAVPAVVSNRMVRRMAIFCGVPTALGIGTFIASYFIVTHHWLKVPHVAVLLVSIGFFGLGVVGLSYGVLSASWDEEVVGTKLGWSEFTTNWGRMISAWRSTKQKNV